jgi:hypothetical protein
MGWVAAGENVPKGPCKISDCGGDDDDVDDFALNRTDDETEEECTKSQLDEHQGPSIHDYVYQKPPLWVSIFSCNTGAKCMDCGIGRNKTYYPCRIGSVVRQRLSAWNGIMDFKISHDE